MWDVVQIRTICLYFIASAQIFALLHFNQNLPGEEPKNQYFTLIKFAEESC